MNKFLVATLLLATAGCPGGPSDDDVYMVAVVSAEIASSNNGTSWDGDGSAPDVRYTLECGTTSFTSATVQDSLAPTWVNTGCTATYAQLKDAQVVIQFVDEDLAASDPISGRTQLQFNESDVTRGEGVFTSVGGVSRFTLKLTEQ